MCVCLDCKICCLCKQRVNKGDYSESILSRDNLLSVVFTELKCNTYKNSIISFSNCSQSKFVKYLNSILNTGTGTIIGMVVCHFSRFINMTNLGSTLAA